MELAMLEPRMLLCGLHDGGLDDLPSNLGTFPAIHAEVDTDYPGAPAGTTDGTATVTVPVAVAEGSYLITASFLGDDVYLPSSATTSFQITRAPSSLAGLAPAGVTLTGVLDGTTQVLQAQPIRFAVTGPGGPTTIWATTVRWPCPCGPDETCTDNAPPGSSEIVAVAGGPFFGPALRRSSGVSTVVM